MNTIIAQDPTSHFNELSSNVNDTRAMLKAIETMLLEPSGHDIECTLHSADAGETANDLHCLVTIALERARQASDLADQFEPMLIALRRPAPHQNTESALTRRNGKRLFTASAGRATLKSGPAAGTASCKGETVLSADEAAFLAGYRNCSKKGQKVIRQLALAARNGLPMPPAHTN